jgi:hypothetical protein
MADTIYQNRQDFSAGFIDASNEELGYVSAVVGTEAANAIEVACTVRNSAGVAATSAKRVLIETLAVTDGKGDIAAATVPVGTLNKAVNPATGPNVAFMTTTAAGLVSFSVANDAAELCLLRITAEGCRPYVVALNFAAV